jgi:hypothetical protein
MGYLLRLFWMALLLLGAARPASALTVDYSASPLGGNLWRYDYFLTNDSTSPINEFTIYFDQASFASLAILDSPLGWDSLVVQPDAALASDGFFDSFAQGAGLLSGTSLGGFSVSFAYLGGGSPGSQTFGVVDPFTFQVVSSGVTRIASPVPEPPQVLLTIAGLGALALATRRRRVSQAASAVRAD